MRCPPPRPARARGALPAIADLYRRESDGVKQISDRGCVPGSRVIKEIRRWCDHQIRGFAPISASASRSSGISLARRTRRGPTGEAQPTLDDYVSHIRELLDFRREQRHVQARANASVPPQAAAELVADAIRFRLGIPVQCPSLGGLTGIGAVADVVQRHPDFVVLISVGEITPTQLDLLLCRIGRVFTASTIMLANWGGWHMSASPPMVNSVPFGKRMHTLGSRTPAALAARRARAVVLTKRLARMVPSGWVYISPFPPKRARADFWPYRTSQAPGAGWPADRVRRTSRRLVQHKATYLSQWLASIPV
jgi:hypothetical protein